MEPTFRKERAAPEERQALDDDAVITTVVRIREDEGRAG